MRRSISDFGDDRRRSRWRSRWLISSAVDWMFASAACLLLGEERLELVAQLVEDREVVGEPVEDAVDDRARSCGRADRPGPSPATSRGPPAASALTSSRDGCVFLAKNAPSSIAAFSTGICSRASSALMPSGRSSVSKMKSNSIATISIVIDSSWFAFLPSGDSCRSRRTLCMPCGMPENATLRAAEVEVGLARLQPRQAFAQRRRGDDRRARARSPTASARIGANVDTRRGGMPPRPPRPAAASPVDRGMPRRRSRRRLPAPACRDVDCGAAAPASAPLAAAACGTAPSRRLRRRRGGAALPGRVAALGARATARPAAPRLTIAARRRRHDAAGSPDAG